jgi:hypothetical protein
MRGTDLIGSQADYRQYRSIKPKYSPCPQCGKKGTRRRGMTRRIPHVAVLHRRSWRGAEVGVYQARCAYCKYFQAPIPGVPSRGRYSLAVRNPVAKALMRARMPSGLVLRRRQEDDRLTLSLGSIHDGFLWAHAQSHLAAHGACVRANFSGVLGIDEVHDSGRPILCATAPLRYFTVFFTLVEKNAQDPMEACLQALKERGLAAQVILTDGSPLSTDARQRSWYDVEHQLCLLHVIKEVNTLLLDGVRAITNRLNRQGTKGRKKRRGRPTKPAHQPRQPRSGMSKKEPASCIWAHPYLIVRTQDDLSAQDQADLALLVQMAPALKLLRPCNQPFARLFAKGMTKQCARARRTRLVNNPLYQAQAFLAKALKKIGKDKFDKMMVFLGWDHGQRTNKHGERHNRVFRMMQKTRYQRRKTHTIENALELERYARMLEHPFYRHNVRELPLLSREKSVLKMAA